GANHWNRSSVVMAMATVVRARSQATLGGWRTRVVMRTASSMRTDSARVDPSGPTAIAVSRDARLAPMNEPDSGGVLVVEDDAELAELLRRLLVGAGHPVEVARDGQSGLHLGLTHGYAVLIIDRGLPGLDGVELLRRLRRRGVDTPALILSAYGTVQDRVTGLDAGAEDYLVKPFEVDELLAR